MENLAPADGHTQDLDLTSHRWLANADVSVLREVVAEQQTKLAALTKELAANVSDLRVKLAHELSEVLNVVERQRENLESSVERQVGSLLRRSEGSNAELLQGLQLEKQERHDAVAELRAEMMTTLAQVRSEGRSSESRSSSSSSLSELTRAIKAEREGRESDVARLRSSFNDMMATAASGVRVELSALQKQLNCLEEREMKLHKEIASAPKPSNQQAGAGDLQRLVEAVEKEQKERVAAQGTVQARVEDLAKQTRRLEREVIEKVGKLLEDPKILGGVAHLSSPSGTRPGSPLPQGSPASSPRLQRGATTDFGSTDHHRAERTVAAAAAALSGGGGSQAGSLNLSASGVGNSSAGTKESALQDLTARLDKRSGEMAAFRLRTAQISGQPWAAARFELARVLEAETEARLEDASKLAACVHGLNRSQDVLRSEMSYLSRRFQSLGSRAVHPSPPA